MRALKCQNQHFLNPQSVIEGKKLSWFKQNKSMAILTSLVPTPSPQLIMNLENRLASHSQKQPGSTGGGIMGL